MRRSTIVDTASRLIFHSALVLSLYLLFAGHNQPGGGFVGGLVAGAAVAVHYVAGGIDDVRAVTRVPPWVVLGSGLTLSAGIAVVVLLFGDGVLEAEHRELHLQVLGDVELNTALLFDIGVYAIVVGLVFMVFEAFGEESLPEPPLGQGHHHGVVGGGRAGESLPEPPHGSGPDR
jgi:multisubunit Na+/H+ antiporter MnhB subunit